NRHKSAISLDCRVDSPVLLTIAQAARLLHLERTWLYRLIARGDVPSIRTPSGLRIAKDVLPLVGAARRPSSRGSRGSDGRFRRGGKPPPLGRRMGKGSDVGRTGGVYPPVSEG